MQSVGTKTYLTKAEAAAYVSEHFFKVGVRTLDTWPVSKFKPNKAVLFERDELAEVARAKIAESATRAA